MQVFKTFFKLVLSYKKIILIYLGVFLGMVTILTKLQYSQRIGGFTEEKLTVGIVDNDNAEYTECLMKFFESKHDIKFIEDDRDVILDELYWRSLDYVLVIPKGFSESLIDKNIEDMELSTMKVPGYFDAEFFETDLSMYNDKLITFLDLGFSYEEANERLMELQTAKTEVKLASFVNTNQNDIIRGVFANMPYFFIAVGVVSISLVLIVFNRQEVKDRTECSPTPMKNRSLGMICAILTFGLILLAFGFLIVVMFAGGEAFTDIRMPYFMINTVSILIFSLSLGFFAGNITNSVEATNGIVNVLSLVLCFLGGVFVPQELFSDEIVVVARFLPTYWYVQNNSMISEVAQINSEFIRKMLLNCSISILAAVAVCVVTLVIMNAKRKRA